MRIPKYKFQVLLLMMLCCAGCNTLSEEDCYIADWEVLGERDGTLGLPVSKIDDHTKGCNRYVSSQDKEKYLQGHQYGLGIFCNSSNAQRQAQALIEYTYFCPSDSEPNYLKGYVKGLDRVLEDIQYELRVAKNDFDKALKQSVKITQSGDKQRLDGYIRRTQLRVQQIEEKKALIEQWLSKAESRM